MLAYISACRGVIGFKVATWLCPVREKVRPARPDVCVSAKKFALQAQNGRKTLFSGALGEFFRGSAGGGAMPGELCRANRYCARSCRRRVPSLPAVVGGFALHEAAAPRVAGVSTLHVVQFPPRRHNKTARRATGRGWSGRRESNPPLKLGKLPFYR